MFLMYLKIITYRWSTTLRENALANEFTQNVYNIVGKLYNLMLFF